MIHQWYSGSDSTLKVAKLITRCKEEFDLAPTQRIALFQAALDIERDPNWRGWLLFAIGDQYREVGGDSMAVASFRAASVLFDPFLRSFPQVVREYCWVFQEVALVLEKADLESDPAELATMWSAVVAHMESGELFLLERIMAHLSLARSLNRLGYQSGDKTYHHLALGHAMRAHVMDPDSATNLAELVYSYYGLGDLGRCRECFAAFLEVAPEGDHRQRIVRFMKESVPAV